ncbi:hypothetical protein BH11BAC2_BH11BAC2_18500 [soil metagenome]
MLLFFLFVGAKASAQFSNAVWCFGDSCGINWSNISSPSIFTSSVVNKGGSVSILDTITGALVYANSQAGQTGPNVQVWNKYNTLLQNGTGLEGEAWYHELQLLPFPNNDSLLMLFGCGVANIGPYGLYYSVINYKANNDSGVVVQKNIMLNTMPAVDALAAVKHGNGRDWWIVFQHWDPINLTPNNDFYIYLLSPLGVTGPFIQSIGSTHITGGACLNFSASGDRFVICNWGQLLELYEFDRCTGVILSTTPVEQESLSPSDGLFYLSCDFSKDGSKLYVSCYQFLSTGNSKLYQYDLTAPSILNSRTILYQFDPDTVQPGNIKRAKDDKIYLTSRYMGPGSFNIKYPDSLYNIYNNNLSVINQPDSLGAACDFQPFSFNLGVGRTYYGLPNNADFELGPLVGSPCDTITAIKEIANEPVFFQAWFKNDWSTLFVNAKQIKGNNALVRIFDSTGRLIKEQKGQVYSGYFAADVVLENLARGVYLVQLVTEKEKLSTKFIY